MTDSHTGAFGAMAAVMILLLKTTALTVVSHRCLALMLVAGWGRWGQLVAIARYPYLKAEGKGAFHKAAIQSLWETIPSLGCLLAISCSPILLGQPWIAAVELALAAVAIAVLTGFWFYSQLGGQTGDTYGAIVEWTEALLLCVMTVRW
jgi:adenosylcobinamide-GDP ribazoletransferase